MDTMDIVTKVQCPYCQHEQDVRFEFWSLYQTARQVVVCSIDEGGCDQPFVAQGEISISTKVFTLVEQAK